MDKKTIKQLQNIVGAQYLTTEPEELLCYSYDATGQEYLPEGVIFPGSTDEVSRIMQLAARVRFPVVPRGAGTGMTGGALPVAGGLVLVMSRFNRILEIDKLNQVAVVEPGVITGRLQQEAGSAGLFYPPDPASLKFCTIGGNVAENAGGPSSVKYGVTRDYVLGLTAVLPDGRIIKTGVRTAKGVVGYDLTRLLVGSEGTLAVITAVILKLLIMPETKRTFLVASRSLSGAVSLVTEILSKYMPCTLEYMDRTAIKIVMPLLSVKLPSAAEALLILELDGDEESVNLQSKKLDDFLKTKNYLLDIKQAKNQQEVADIWAARRSISPASFKLKPHKISEDVVVPRSRISELVTHTEKLGKKLNLVIFTFGHAGDGNIHVNIMLDKENPDELQRGQIARKLLFEEVIRLAGTLSGEHGIGITKSLYLPLELSDPTLAVMREIKQLFDPHNILNPGKIFPIQMGQPKK